MATALDAAEDTFPKLLMEHARVRGDRPALRHKDAGIWQTWSWSDLLREVRAIALGLSGLGIKRGDTVAIAGNNRPRLYQSILAAQALGAIPVPLYADAIATELAYVLDHADVTVTVVQDQEQVDKILSVQEQLPKLKHIVYDETRGLRDYDHSRLHDLGKLIADNEALMARDAESSARIDREIAAGKGTDPSIILYTSGTTGRSKGVVLSGARCITAASDTVAFDKLTDRDIVLAYLPLAWVGDHYLNYAQSLVARLVHGLSESPDTAQQDLREIGPTFYFAEHQDQGQGQGEGEGRHRPPSPDRLTPGARSAPGQHLLDDGGHPAAVGAPGHLGLGGLHDQAHLRHPRRPGGLDGARDDGLQLVVAELRRQVPLEHDELGLLDRGQLGAAGVGVGRRRLLALLGLLGHDLEHLVVAQLARLVTGHLGVGDGGQRHPQGARAHLVAGLDRVVQVVLELRLERCVGHGPSLPPAVRGSLPAVGGAARTATGRTVRRMPGAPRHPVPFAIRPDATGFARMCG